jgi:hypothetical protein
MQNNIGPRRLVDQVQRELRQQRRIVRPRPRRARQHLRDGAVAARMNVTRDRDGEVEAGRIADRAGDAQPQHDAAERQRADTRREPLSRPDRPEDDRELDRDHDADRDRSTRPDAAAAIVRRRVRT